jgi:hypothetical protein
MTPTVGLNVFCPRSTDKPTAVQWPVDGLLLWPRERGPQLSVAKCASLTQAPFSVGYLHSPSVMVLVTTSLRGKVNMERERDSDKKRGEHDILYTQNPGPSLSSCP